MHPRYEDLTPPELGLLTEENLYDFFSLLSQHAGSEMIRTPDLTFYSDSSIISPMFNGVIRAKLPPDRVDQIIRQTIDDFAARQRPIAFWWVGPSTQPADIGARLLAHGLVEFEIDAPSMAVDLHALSESAAMTA